MRLLGVLFSIILGFSVLSGTAQAAPPPSVCIKNPQNPNCVVATPTPNPTPTRTPAPTATPTLAPTPTPTVAPTLTPTATPTVAPTVAPTATPTTAPTATPTSGPTATPSPTTPAGPNPLTCTGYPEQRVFLESQGWWNKEGLQIPEAVGHHIHVGMCTPLDGTILNGTVHFDVRIILHDQVGKVNWLRLSDRNGEIDRIDLTSKNFGNCHDCTLWVPFDVNFSTWATGRHELRWTANVPDEQPDGLPGSDSGPQRMFQSTGWQYCVRACTPNLGDRPSHFITARGWYQLHEYANAALRSAVPTAPLKGVWAFTFDAKPGDGGLPTKEYGVFIDPNFHAGLSGITVERGTGEARLRSTSFDTRTLADGVHRLVIVSSDGNNAGVQLVTFVVDN